jgi:hypothetical protein
VAQGAASGVDGCGTGLWDLMQCMNTPVKVWPSLLLSHNAAAPAVEEGQVYGRGQGRQSVGYQQGNTTHKGQGVEICCSACSITSVSKAEMLAGPVNQHHKCTKETQELRWALSQKREK